VSKKNDEAKDLSVSHLPALQLQDAFPWHGQWTPRHGLSKAYVLLGWMDGKK